MTLSASFLFSSIPIRVYWRPFAVLLWPFLNAFFVHPIRRKFLPLCSPPHPQSTHSGGNDPSAPSQFPQYPEPCFCADHPTICYHAHPMLLRPYSSCIGLDRVNPFPMNSGCRQTMIDRGKNMCRNNLKQAFRGIMWNLRINRVNG